MYVWQYLHTLKHRDEFDFPLSVAETDPNPKNPAVKIDLRRVEWISPFYFVLALALMHLDGTDLDPWYVGGTSSNK